MEYEKLLKDCPFCGHEAQMRTSYEEYGDATWKYVQCTNCRVRTSGQWFNGSNDCPVFYEGVREQWNRREE